jgi:hypothetical protein
MDDIATRGVSSNRPALLSKDRRAELVINTNRRELERAVWERVMKRLRISTRMLSAILLALLARVIVSGLSVATELSAAIITPLLLGSVLLTRHGHRLEPRQPFNPHGKPR